MEISVTTGTTALDGETIRIIVTAVVGLLGTLIGGILNYIITNGRIKKELQLEKMKYDNEREDKENEKKEVMLQEKKKVYSEYIDVAIRYAAKKDNIDDLRNKTLEVVLVGTEKVAKVVSAYYTEINDEINKDLEFSSVRHDIHINSIINAIRKEIYEESDDIYVHLVDNDK